MCGGGGQSCRGTCMAMGGGRWTSDGPTTSFIGLSSLSRDSRCKFRPKSSQDWAATYSERHSRALDGGACYLSFSDLHVQSFRVSCSVSSRTRSERHLLHSTAGCTTHQKTVPQRGKSGTIAFVCCSFSSRSSIEAIAPVLKLLRGRKGGIVIPLANRNMLNKRVSGHFGRKTDLCQVAASS